jgi:GT2 family glycosyltransferase
MALRTDREYFMRIAGGADPKKVFARENSFLDFHILDAPKRVLRKLLGRRSRPTRSGVRYAKIPFGIYGGLLFHKQLLDRVGYPDEDFYLYGDDTDFTARITEDGGELFLVSGSRIRDLESSWHVSSLEDKTSRLRKLVNAPEYRIYYAIRNGVFLSVHRWRTRLWVWRVNKVFFMALLHVYMYWIRRMDRWHLVARAVRDGIWGNLGEDKNLRDNSPVEGTLV